VSSALAAVAATDVPGVRLLGIAIGVLLFAAIRALFGGGRGRRR
jgi:hypothetical protein